MQRLFLFLRLILASASIIALLPSHAFAQKSIVRLHLDLPEGVHVTTATISMEPKLKVIEELIRRKIILLNGMRINNGRNQRLVSDVGMFNNNGLFVSEIVNRIQLLESDLAKIQTLREHGIIRDQVSLNHAVERNDVFRLNILESRFETGATLIERLNFRQRSNLWMMFSQTERNMVDEGLRNIHLSVLLVDLSHGDQIARSVGVEGTLNLPRFGFADALANRFPPDFGDITLETSASGHGTPMKINAHYTRSSSTSMQNWEVMALGLARPKAIQNTCESLFAI